MNHQDNISYVSRETMERYLRGTLSPGEKAKVDQLLKECELSGEAMEGFQSVPDAWKDIPDLEKAIWKRSGASAARTWWITAGVVAVIGLTVVFFQNYFGKERAIVTKADPVTVDTQPAPQPAAVLSYKEEHYVKPEAQPVKVVELSDKISDAPETPVVYEELPPEVLYAVQPPKEITSSDQKTSSEINSSKEYNAQVGFILELKVTEFDRLYREDRVIKEQSLPGVPAQFESGDHVTGEDKEVLVPADKYLREGLAFFRDAKYGKCISRMEVLLNNDSTDINAVFYIGVSYVKLEMYSKALSYLDKVIQMHNNVFDEEALWYKAQALEGMGNQAAARELYQRISQEGGFYSGQAGQKLK